MMTKEIRPGIYSITTKSRFPALKPPVNIYVLVGEQSLIFDAGYGLKSDVLYVTKHLDRIASKTPDKNKFFKNLYILPSHSHADHFSGAGLLKEFTGAKIILTDMMQKILASKKNYMDNYRDAENDYGPIKRAISGLTEIIYQKSVGMRFIKNADMVVREDFQITISGRTWQIIPMPGHSSDHISLYCEKDGILLGGDNVLRSVITWLGPPDSDFMMYEKTLKKMLALTNLRIILTAHGSRIVNPSLRINEILSHRKKRTANVLSIIKNKSKNGAGIKSIQDVLYPGSGFLMRFNSEGWIRLALKELKEKALISEIKKGKKTFYIANDNL